MIPEVTYLLAAGARTSAEADFLRSLVSGPLVVEHVVTPTLSALRTWLRRTQISTSGRSTLSSSPSPSAYLRQKSQPWTADISAWSDQFKSLASSSFRRERDSYSLLEHATSGLHRGSVSVVCGKIACLRSAESHIEAALGQHCTQFRGRGNTEPGRWMCGGMDCA